MYSQPNEISVDSSKILRAEFDALDGLVKNYNSDKVSVASYVDIVKNEAPSVITTITSQDIEELGARDLIDVLNSVPGFNLGTDVQNGIAYGIRGNWAEEGKILYMIDGLPLNEMGYGTYVVGHRFPINTIERIEIIRGAGSALYGGLAGLGVVNIITKKGQKINGHKLYVQGGLSNPTLSRAGINYVYGGTLKSGGEVTMSGLLNFGNRSNRKVVLPDSSTVNMKDSSKVINQNFNLNILKNNYNIKFNYEDYNFQSTFEPIVSTTKTFIGELNRAFTYKKINLTPFFRYKWQYPWLTDHGDPLIYEYQNTISSRWNAGFNANYIHSSRINLSFGANAYSDFYRYYKFGLQQKLVGKPNTNFNGIALYSELYYDLKFTKLFLGIRFDKYAFFKPSYAPRLTITKSYKNIFYKVLGNISYKLPTHQNIMISNNNNIKPELIKETQIQVGYFNHQAEFSATGFYTYLNDMIIYDYDSLQESYRNSGFIKTVGYELEGKYRISKVKFTANYSYYLPLSSNAKDVLIDKDAVSKGTLSLPKHRIYVGINYNVTNNITINLFELFQSRTIIPTNLDAAGTIGNYSLQPGNTLNATCQIKNLHHNNNLKLNFGVYNLLNQKHYLGYAYQSGYQPMTEMGLELFVQLRVNL